MATLPKPKKRLVRGSVRWVVDLRSVGAGRFFFEDKDKAEQLYLSKLEEVKDYGRQAHSLSHKDRIQFLAARDRLAAVGASIDDSVQFFLDHGEGFNKKTLEDAIEDFKAAKETANVRQRYADLLATTLKSFVNSVEVKHCHEVTRAMVEKWLNGNDWKPPTRKSYLTNLRTFFGFCKGQKWVKLNPTAGIPRIILDDKPPGILTVEEVKRLLRRCLRVDPELSWFLAIQLFAGPRPVEMSRLRSEDIKAEFIEIKSSKSKTRRRRLVTINPTLKAWLKPEIQMPIKNLRRRLNRLKLAVEKTTKRGKKIWKPVVPWSHDCLRHSFCSYHLAQHKNAAMTALEAGHSEAVLFGSYRELVTAADAKEFWSLTPEKLKKHDI